MRERSDAPGAVALTVEEVQSLAREELLASLRQGTRVRPVQARDMSGLGREFAAEGPAAAGGVIGGHWLNTVPTESPSVGEVDGPVVDASPSAETGPVPERSGVSLWEVLEGRMSAVSERRVDADVLWAVMQALGMVRHRREDDVGRLWQSRLYPSAGGTHCIEPLLYIAPTNCPPVGFDDDPGAPPEGVDDRSVGASDGGRLQAGWYRYQGGAGARDLVRVSFPDESRVLAAATDALHASSPPPVIVFAVADPDVLGARYPGGSSLLWRDAGAFLMTGHLVATASGALSTIVGVCVELASSQSNVTPPFVVGAVAMGGATHVDNHEAGRTS